jgi:hypothetical protein
MGRLPTFHDATFDELLDIRKELAPSLTQFRSAMVTISKTFTSAAWESDFEDEVHDTWVESVLPAVKVIDASVRGNQSLFALAVGRSELRTRAIQGSALSPQDSWDTSALP